MNWDNYFMDIAHTVAKKSKDLSTQVGAVIVDKEKRVVSLGFNGFVKGCDESKMTHERPMKYHLVCHAEMNAILFARRDLAGCVMYCTHAPCENCLKYILQTGIREIYYQDSEPVIKRGSLDQIKAILRLMISTNAGVRKLDSVGSYAIELQREIRHREKLQSGQTQEVAT